MIRYKLRQLEYLIACVDTGSLAAAAEKLHVSQPSISAAISKLEDSLGVQLLLRHHAQGVSPTANGDRLLQSARNILNHAEDLQHQAAEAGNAVAGTLNLGSFATLAPVYLPGMVAELKQLYPQMQLKLTEGTQNRLIYEMRQGGLEMALVYDIDIPEDLTFTELSEMPPYVLLPADHACAVNDQVSLKDLVDDPFVLLDVSPSRNYFTGVFSHLGLEPNIAFSSPSLELVRGLVGRGLGYSLLVTRPHGDLTYDGQELAIRPLADNVPGSRIGLVRLKTMRPTQLMKAFEKFSQSWFEGY